MISGGDDPTIFEYAEYNYGAEDDEEETEEYDLGYFFEEGENSGDYVIEAPAEQLERQLYAAYPPRDVMERSAVMVCFDEAQSAAINRMWINVRCYNLSKAPVWAFVIAAAVFCGIVFLAVKRIKDEIKRRAAMK